MRNATWMLVIGAIILAGAVYFVFNKPANKAPTPPVVAEKETSLKPTQTPQPPQQIMPLTITSPAFTMNGTIPSLFTCDGKNISPELDFANIPEGTQSLALTMEDPDVPKSARADGMWNHWIVWNIPPTTTQIKEGTTPSGIVGKNTGGKTAYAGPCPPDREHRYIFTLYALDSILTLPQGSTKEELLQAIASHLIEKAQLIGLYNRN